MSSAYLKQYVKYFRYLLECFKHMLDARGAVCYTGIVKEECKRMNIEQKIKMALGYANISQAELARRLGTTPQNLHYKIKRNTLTFEDMAKIADVLGAEWVAEFRFEDGTRI